MNIISNFRPDVPQYKLNMDLEKLQTMGVPVSDAYNTLQTFLGGLYVNDFNLYGHTWQVMCRPNRNFARASDVDRYLRPLGDDGSHGSAQHGGTINPWPGRK